MATYDTVKDYVIQQIQKTFSYSRGIARSLCEDNYITFDRSHPDYPQLQVLADADDDIRAIENEEFKLMHSKDVKCFVKWKETHRQNKAKAYAFIMGYCTKGLQNKIEE